MEKRGQFFIIAALIIVIIIMGLATSYVSFKAPEEDIRIYDLSNEINFESSKVIDRGVISGSNAEVYNNLKQLSDSYALLNPDSDFVIYYGDETGIKARSYETESTGTIGLDLGVSDPIYDDITNRNIGELDIDPENFICLETDTVCKSGIGIEVRFTDENQKSYDYKFKLRKGQNFFIILKKEDRDERIVVSNE